MVPALLASIISYAVGVSAGWQYPITTGKERKLIEISQKAAREAWAECSKETVYLEKWPQLIEISAEAARIATEETAEVWSLIAVDTAWIQTLHQSLKNDPK